MITNIPPMRRRTRVACYTRVMPPFFSSPARSVAPPSGGYAASLARLLIAVSAFMWMADASAAVFKYRDPETGGIIFTNVRRDQKADAETKSTPGQEAVAPSAPRTELLRETQAEAASRSRPAREESLLSAPALDAIEPTTNSRSKGEFPRVSVQAQRRRDLDRRMILVDELRAEKNALDTAVNASATLETVEKHRRNVEALEREIARIR